MPLHSTARPPFEPSNACANVVAFQSPCASALLEGRGPMQMSLHGAFVTLRVYEFQCSLSLPRIMPNNGSRAVKAIASHCNQSAMFVSTPAESVSARTHKAKTQADLLKQIRWSVVARVCSFGLEHRLRGTLTVATAGKQKPLTKARRGRLSHGPKSAPKWKLLTFGAPRICYVIFLTETC